MAHKAVITINIRKWLLICFWVIVCTHLFHINVFAGKTPINFSLHKLGPVESDRTLLVVGGIQGDEPGGFHAASLLTTHYKIKKGNVWIVPNLNFLSIIRRSRGVHGDLNRKFAAIKKNDPEYEIIHRIKTIMLMDEVDLILNLHDGSGFYRQKYYDWAHCPDRWGQSIIIDQEAIDVPKFGNLGDIARQVIQGVNKRVSNGKHIYRVKNTKTREGNIAMAKTLTFFAINHGKPAFGVEASKSLKKEQRVLYHLLVLESFMNQVGIEFERNFDLTAKNIHKALIDNRTIAFYDNRIFVEMQRIRNRLNYFPLKRSGSFDFNTKDPLITVVKKKKQYEVYHGNERITVLSPQYFDYDNKPPSLNVIVDGKRVDVSMGQVLRVNKSFKILPKNGYRVNAIGFTVKNMVNESGVTIAKKDFKNRYSLTRDGDMYRIEVYKTTAQGKKRKSDKFAGMIMVKFDDPPSS